MVTLGVHERTPNFAWQGAKAASNLYMDEKSPHRGLGCIFVQISILSRSQVTDSHISKISLENS